MDTAKFKAQLLEEKARLETELSTIARPDASNPDNWDAVPDEAEGVSQADRNEMADTLEDLEENIGISNELEARLKDVNDALERIENGTYGKDEKTGEQIPEERLEANPAARTASVE